MCTDPCIANAINAHRPEVTGCYSQPILEISSALLCARAIFGRNVRGPFFPPPILYSRIPRPRMFLKCVWVRSEDIYLSPSFNLSLGRGNAISIGAVSCAIHWRAYYAHFLTQFSGKCDWMGNIRECILPGSIIRYVCAKEFLLEYYPLTYVYGLHVLVII